MLLGLWFLCFSNIVFAQESRTEKTGNIPIYVFERDGCRHCEDEKIFLQKLSSENSLIIPYFLNIDQEPYATQWREIARVEKLPLATPITVVGNTVIQGFDTEETTGKRIRDLAEKNTGVKTLTPQEIIDSGGTKMIEKIIDPSSCSDESSTCTLTKNEPILVRIPLLGEKDLSAYSLPVLSSILGFIDGFNPCAMWVLVTFLVLLSRMRSRKRMFLVAGIFILAESSLYWLILNVWLTAWNFVALDRIVTPLVGVLAIGGGMFFLFEWSRNDGTCAITGGTARERILRKIEKIVSGEFSLFLLAGIIGLAFSVNIIEFACSIGIPQAFTKILEINMIGSVQEQFFMGIYIFFYMLDDLIVFGIALWSIQAISLTSRYSVWTNFLGGILMLILGFLLLFSPNALRFV